MGIDWGKGLMVKSMINGMAVGISQDKFVNLVKSKELKQLLTDLPLEDWQIKSFDRKTRKAELRVQNRYITVGV